MISRYLGFPLMSYVSLSFLLLCYARVQSRTHSRQIILNEDGQNHVGPFNYSQNQPLTDYEGQDDNTKGAYNYSQYQPFEKIVKELHHIAKKSDKHIKRSVFAIGKTFENRTLWAIKFQQVDGDGKKKKKKTIVVDCGAHAREWIAPSTCMYLIHEMSTPTELLPVLKKYDWVVIPLLNPDGYVYTWHNKTTRMWRKNRSYDDEQMKRFKETGNPLCIGVDINRNFNKAWGGPAAPVNEPCYEMYCGSKPFSEKESAVLANYLRAMRTETIAYVTLHCYGQHWMTPWGFTSKRPKEYKEMRRVARLAVAKMKDYSGVLYSIGPSHDELYPNSGSSTDWAYSTLETPYTYLIEMMPAVESGDASFKLPPSMMVKNAKDILQGLLVMATELKEDVI